MNEKIISIRDNPGYLEKAIDYFASKWGNRIIYDDCIKNSLVTDSPLPRWYIMVRDNEVIGSYGLITNDFISRQDLYPWLCALYIEETERGNAFGSKLLEHGRREAAKLGYGKLYLCTDHEGYYEKYGWKHIAMGYHPWGEDSKIYKSEVLSD